ncbi:MAG: signal transduction protein [Pseudomonadota bacterium]
MINNGDLRLSANRQCWPVQRDYEDRLTHVMQDRYGIGLVKANRFHDADEHGFVACQAEGNNTFSSIDPDAPLIVLLTVWQYSHHIAAGLVHHRGPILLLANFAGTWPGLVGMLNLAGSLTALGRSCSRLWSADFDDEFFLQGLDQWLQAGEIHHDTSYLQAIEPGYASGSLAAEVGEQLGKYMLHKKEIMGIYDMFCMGMVNGVFPLKSLVRIGMPLEPMSQSQLLADMQQVPQSLREECLQYYIDRGMDFRFGENPEDELTREQVLEQCAMMIAAARAWKKFGCTAIGIQYQQGLKDCYPASDFAEGALNDSDRFPIPDENGDIIAPGNPIPCINEVDMGTGIPQILLCRLLDSLGLPSETTLHDIRWGSEFEGTFYWDFEVSGNVPFSHLKGGIAGAIGNRQPKMYFPLGGSTISGQCKAGRFIWARAHYENLDVHLHVGTGTAYELPPEEFQRRLDATTPEWPLMNVTLDNVTRDELMAGHQSNHITIAYIPEEQADVVRDALVVMGQTLGIRVWLAGRQLHCLLCAP